MEISLGISLTNTSEGSGAQDEAVALRQDSGMELREDGGQCLREIANAN